MNIQFNIPYQLQYGEDILVNIIAPNGQVRRHRMSVRSTSYSEVQCSSAGINIDATGNDHIDYYYTIERGDQPTRTEWRKQTHRLSLNLTGIQQYTTHDLWTDTPKDTYLYTDAYTKCIHRRNNKAVVGSSSSTILRLKVRAPQMQANKRLVVTGNEAVMGNWDPFSGIDMQEIAPNEWIADIDAEQIKSPHFEYKFVIIPSASAGSNTISAPCSDNGGRNEEVQWETGGNRCLDTPMIHRGEIYELEHSQAFFDIKNPRYAGTLIPVFSLRTDGSFGVGDFGDLKKMIDWIAYTGQKILQILPVNDTTSTKTWTDSYPYSCISIFALHPQYMDLRQLPAFKESEKANAYEQKRRALNALQQIDYEEVNKAKEEYLHDIYLQEGRALLQTEEFHSWFNEEQHWLIPYAQYCYLRDKEGTADFTKWKGHESWNEEEREPLYLSAMSKQTGKDSDGLSYYYFVQYLLAKQMKEVHEYARQKHVVLKGDIPIGVDRHGCDVWQYPHYFNLNAQAGAPPDAFSATGQNWGFPTYNWEVMYQDGCRWWRDRFKNMAKYFDAYRIDHVLGFFRIWEIPIQYKDGLLGQFQPSLGFTRTEIESYGLHFQEGRFCRPNTASSLFLHDHKDPELFHPRISVQYDPIYDELSEAEKEAFNHLYDDYFYHRNTHFWYNEAMRKLPLLIDATRMLVCAEDLGMVPDCVPWVMNDLQILSLELQSMPKQPGMEFGRTERYPYLSVCTIDSHDMPTLRMWWDEDEERADHFYHDVLHRRDQVPHPMPGWLARDIILRNLQCPSMFCILSLQDWLGTDETVRLADANAERINIPADTHHYWRYRMHVNIEDLLKNQRFCDDIMEMIQQSGR